MESTTGRIEIVGDGYAFRFDTTPAAIGLAINVLQLLAGRPFATGPVVVPDVKQEQPVDADDTTLSFLMRNSLLGKKGSRVGVIFDYVGKEGEDYVFKNGGNRVFVNAYALDSIRDKTNDNWEFRPKA